MGECWEKYQRFVCVFLVLLISRREEKQRKQKIYKAKYGTKKTSCSTRKCYTRSHFLDFLGRSQDAQMCLFRAVRGYLRFPMTIWIIPTRQNKSQSKQFCIGDLTLFGFIWFQISISHRVSDFLLSKIYQGVIAMIANVTEQTMLQSSYEIILPRSCLLCKR